MSHNEISSSLRAAIITLKTFTDLTYEEIERKIGVAPAAAKSIYLRAVAHAENYNFHNVLKNIEPRYRSGRLEVVQKGSEEFLRLRFLLLANPYDTFAKVIRDENIPYARSTIEKIAKQHSSPEIPRPIVRKNICIKPYLDNATVGSRLKFCHWALSELNDGAIFIFSNETYINFGGVSPISFPC